MQFIRAQKASPGFDQNLTHCIYGLDADLMMLALTTHEPNFCLLREEVLNKESKNSRKDIFQVGRFFFVFFFFCGFISTFLRPRLSLFFCFCVSFPLSILNLVPGVAVSFSVRYSSSRISGRGISCDFERGRLCL